MKLSESAINEHLARLDGWRREGDEIVREGRFANFQSALEFVNQVAAAAEAMDHHPDILLHSWNKVRLSVTTHDAGGLTEKDFKLAAQINQLLM